MPLPDEELVALGIKRGTLYLQLRDILGGQKELLEKRSGHVSRRQVRRRGGVIEKGRG